MAYNIIAAASFENDLDLTTAYIAQILHNPAAARKLLGQIQETIQLIAEHPYMFSLFPDDEVARMGYRNTHIARYELFYRVDENARTVYILRFLYAGQDISSILK